jgi:hypothetical protein
MTDLRSALLEACDLIANLLPFATDREANAPRLPEWRSLADAPLCVLDALRDPEVRAGRVWIATEHEGWGGNCHRLVKIADDIIWVCRWRDGDIRGRLDWGPAVVRPADLDAPCRLVPAEGGGE